MTRAIAILLLLIGCKFNLSTKSSEQPVTPDQMKEVIALSSQEQSLGKALCQALDQKRSLFRTLHDGRTFDFQLEQYDCGTKVSSATVAATLRASVGQAMTYEAPSGSQLYFTDVLTSTDGITHFLCDKIAAGKVIQNTIVVDNIETIQIRLGGDVPSGIILEISDFIANSQGEHVFKNVQSIKFHAKLSNLSDFTGLEMERAISKKCLADGKLSSGSLQKSLESLP